MPKIGQIFSISKEEHCNREGRNPSVIKQIEQQKSYSFIYCPSICIRYRVIHLTAIITNPRSTLPGNPILQMGKLRFREAQ